MRLLHFSDTHLGYQAFDRVEEHTGVNAREQDFYNAFEYVINRAIAERPAVVVHSGDFFHRPSPSNRALTFALEQLRRLSDAHIPLFLIAGNHETPRTSYNSPILRALRSLPGIHPVFEQRWETFSIDRVTLHGLPHLNDERLFRQELMRIEPTPDRFNLLLLHTSVGKRFLMEEYGEQMLPEELVHRLSGFQYLALGHWHNAQKISAHHNGWYAGSTERLSETEVGAEKGFLWVDVHSTAEASISFEAIPTRPWLRQEIRRCNEYSVADLLSRLNDFARGNDLRQAIVSVILSDIQPEQAAELSNWRLKEIFKDTFQLLIRRRLYTAAQQRRSAEASSFERIEDLFAHFVRQQMGADPSLADALIEKAQHYFRQSETYSS